MHVIFWFARKGYELQLGPHLVRGAAEAGIKLELRPLDEYKGPGGDAGMICGVVKREVLWEHQAKRHPLLYLDKGYIRARQPFHGANPPAWWRVCVNAVHPAHYVMHMDGRNDRLMTSPMRLFSRVPLGEAALIAGSSAKFHKTARIEDPTAWTEGVVRKLRASGFKGPIIYRPKPSWNAARPVEGAEFDHGKKTPFGSALRRAAFVITYGSIASVDAICAGVPVISLGPSPALPICSRHVESWRDPMWAPAELRRAWGANLSYCHWRPTELERGYAWREIRSQLDAFGALPVLP